MVQVIDKGLAQALEVALVGRQVIGIDIRHHGHGRLQVQKRGVALVGFRHQVITCTQLRMARGTVQLPADHEGRVQATFRKQAGGQAGGRGLAMGAGDTDAETETHQFGEHLGARHHGDALFPRRQDFGVIRRDGG